VAYIDYGEWFNPYSEQYETVEGVWCQCYECKRMTSCNWAGPEENVFFTKSEYREHREERRQAYNAYIENKISNEELKSAHTKETEASEGHGRPSGVTTLFDLETGNMVPDPSIVGAVRWETLWRASIQED
jgi:hypothetical protein